jgi:hypothetical protein
MRGEGRGKTGRQERCSLRCTKRVQRDPNFIRRNAHLLLYFIYSSQTAVSVPMRPQLAPFHTFQKHHRSRVTSCHHCKYVHHSPIHALLLKSVCTSVPDTTRTRTRMSSGCLIRSMGPHTIRRKVELLQEKRTFSGESCTIHR